MYYKVNLNVGQNRLKINKAKIECLEFRFNNRIEGNGSEHDVQEANLVMK